MAALKEEAHVTLFRAADAYAVEVVRAAQRIGEGRDATLMKELRRSALRCGGALVAASVARPRSASAQSALESVASGSWTPGAIAH